MVGDAHPWKLIPTKYCDHENFCVYSRCTQTMAKWFTSHQAAQCRWHTPLAFKPGPPRRHSTSGARQTPEASRARNLQGHCLCHHHVTIGNALQTSCGVRQIEAVVIVHPQLRLGPYLQLGGWVGRYAEGVMCRVLETNLNLMGPELNLQPQDHKPSH